MISEDITERAPALQPEGGLGPLRTRNRGLESATVQEQQRVRVAEQNRSKLEALVDSLDTLVAHVDREERLIWVNKAFEAHWSRSRSELVGMRIADLLSPAAYARARKRIARALRGETRTYEYEVEWRGEPSPVMTTYLPDEDDNGMVRGFFVTTNEISRIKMAEHAQKQALEEADAANRAKSRFLASISHEIRTPLNAIIGFADLLAREGHLNAAQSDYVKTIVSSGEVLLTIINDVLELSRIEAGTVELNPTEFNLYSLVHEVHHMFEGRVVDRPVALRLEAGEDAHVTLHGDTARIRQTLINLMSNALKFTDRGTVTLRASTTSDRESPNLRRVRLEVEDTGCGIPADQLESVFDEFVRIDAQPGPIEGTGLGLSLCRTFAQLMGGTISATSEIGVGSTFTLELALRQITQLAPSTDQVSGGAPGRSKGLDLAPSRASEQFERLPTSIRNDVALAAAAADTDRLARQLSSVDALNPPLAGLLRSMLHRFDFESILHVTGEAGDV